MMRTMFSCLLSSVYLLFFFIATLFIYLFYLFLAVLGLRFCARAFSSCGKRGPLFIAVRGPFTIVAPPVAGHRLQTHRLSSCGSRAQLLRGMWDLPRPGLKPVSPALAGRFSTTAPPGKPCISSFVRCLFKSFVHFSVELFLELSFKSSLHILGKSSFIRYIFSKYSHLACGLSSHSLDSVFCRAEDLHSNEVQFINYFFHGLSFWCCI